jgi:hypothetical protein
MSLIADEPVLEDGLMGAIGRLSPRDKAAIHREITRRDAEIRALKARVAELDRRPMRGIEAAVAGLRPAPQAKQRVVDLMELVPPGIVGKSAVHKWCYTHKAVTGAVQRGSQWYVSPDAFWNYIERCAAKKRITTFLRPLVDF